MDSSVCHMLCSNNLPQGVVVVFCVCGKNLLIWSLESEIVPK